MAHRTPTRPRKGLKPRSLNFEHPPTCVEGPALGPDGDAASGAAWHGRTAASAPTGSKSPVSDANGKKKNRPASSSKATPQTTTSQFLSPKPEKFNTVLPLAGLPMNRFKDVKGHYGPDYVPLYVPRQQGPKPVQPSHPKTKTLVGVPNLAVEDVVADGNCLHRSFTQAVTHANRRRVGAHVTHTHSRRMVAEFLATHPPLPESAPLQLVDYHGRTLYSYQLVWLDQKFRHPKLHTKALQWADRFQAHRVQSATEHNDPNAAALLPQPIATPPNGTWGEYAQHAETDKSWSGEIEVIALATLFNRAIHVVIANICTNCVDAVVSFAPGEGWWESPPSTDAQAPKPLVGVFLVTFGGRSHYQWLWRPDGAKTKDLLASLTSHRNVVPMSGVSPDALQFKLNQLCESMGLAGGSETDRLKALYALFGVSKPEELAQGLNQFLQGQNDELQRFKDKNEQARMICGRTVTPIVFPPDDPPSSLKASIDGIAQPRKVTYLSHVPSETSAKNAAFRKPTGELAADLNPAFRAAESVTMKVFWSDSLTPSAANAVLDAVGAVTKELGDVEEAVAASPTLVSVQHADPQRSGKPFTAPIPITLNVSLPLGVRPARVVYGATFDPTQPGKVLELENSNVEKGEALIRLPEPCAWMGVFLLSPAT